MPLRAILNDQDIQAFNYSEAEWLVLKSHYRDNDLLMACYESNAIPKTKLCVMSKVWQHTHDFTHFFTEK